MEYDKKIFLVDRTCWCILKIKSHSNTKNYWKRDTLDRLKKVTSSSDLEIESISSDNTISDDQKIKIYSAALNRYLCAAKSIERTWFAQVLGKLFKMRETAVITSEPDAEEMEAEKMTEDRVV